jgi:hypothetical protein
VRTPVVVAAAVAAVVEMAVAEVVADIAVATNR